MKTAMFILSYVTLAVLAHGCGKAHVQSPEAVKAITDTFVEGQTTTADVLNSLGAWSYTGATTSSDYVVYFTADGGSTLVAFAPPCGSDFNRSCFAGAVQRH